MPLRMRSGARPGTRGTTAARPPGCLGLPCTLIRSLCATQDEERSEAGHEGDDSSPASKVRRRYERMFKDRDSAEAMSDEAAKAAADAREAANAAARTAFHGSIATVFTKHLRQGCCGLSACAGHAACLPVT